jgi:hypothetical protein
MDGDFGAWTCNTDCCAPEECDACDCIPTSLGMWWQYQENDITCYTCDVCDTTEFQVILSSAAAFTIADMVTELHSGCTAVSSTSPDQEKSWLLDRVCISAYYTGTIDSGCRVCEFVEDPGICEDMPAFIASRQEWLFYATLAGEGADCTIRFLAYRKVYNGSGATAEEACENLCLGRVYLIHVLTAGTTGDCCDYHDVTDASGDLPSLNTQWICDEDCDSLTRICPLGFAIAPPPPPGDPKYGSLEYIC